MMGSVEGEGEWKRAKEMAGRADKTACRYRLPHPLMCAREHVRANDKGGDGYKACRCFARVSRSGFHTRSHMDMDMDMDMAHAHARTCLMRPHHGHSADTYNARVHIREIRTGHTCARGRDV